MEIIEFRKILTSDTYDDYYNDNLSWSRIYEYPLIISTVKRFYKTGKTYYGFFFYY